MTATGAPRGWGRHFEGWPWAAWWVFAAAISAALVVPRPVEPELVPPPEVDRRQQQRELDLETRRAGAAEAGLPLEVRSVGEALRRFGRAAFDAAPVAVQLRIQLRRLARVAADRHGPERLLELRALQARLFVAALKGSQTPADAADDEVRELGGRFAAAALERGWFASPPAGADPAERATLFRMYWNESLGLSDQHPYAATLNEWRVYYRFLLARPLGEGSEQSADVRRRLGYVAALSRHDQTYPARLARGVLFYQAGAYAQAAAELRTHLSQHPTGPWTLRAKNHLAACGAALSE